MYKTKYRKYKSKYLNLKYQTLYSNMKSSYDNLTSSLDQTHTFVNLDLGAKDLNDLSMLKVINERRKVYFGIYSRKKFRIMITEYLKEIGNNDQIAMKSANILTNIIESYLHATNRDYLWFEMRPKLANNHFDIPRWHTDGYFYDRVAYSESQQPQYKLAGALIGPTTLFKLDNPEILSTYFETRRSLDKDISEMEARKIIIEALAEYPMHQPGNGEAAIFAVGSVNRSAVHSEPPFDIDRIFYSVLTGTHDQINDLATSWGHEFVSN